MRLGSNRCLCISLFAAVVAPRLASARDGFSGVPAANSKSVGVPAPNVLTPELFEVVVAQGSMVLDGGNTNFPYYGYDGDNAALVPGANSVQSPGHNVEATKTEPDKNTYLVLDGQHGPDLAYAYGRHFLFQGHELGATDPNTGLGMSYVTRINLDADGAHRVTLMASAQVNGTSIPPIDGSTWDPWADRLLLTSEGGSKGAVLQATVDYPSAVEDVSGIFGRGGYEGIQNDSDGNVWVVEDSGGVAGVVNTHAKQPNSFIYRLLPYDRTDLKQGGRMQALQVMSISNPGQPIVFHAGQADADILSQDVKDLHTYGKSFNTHWVTIHDTAVDGFTPFDANALAKAAQCTPFKRPENGQFRPDGRFRQFFFDETGDTNEKSEAGSQYGGFGSIMMLSQKRPSDSSGTLSLFFQCDVDHTGFDNCAFWDRNHVVFVEDRGDGLHTSHDAFDSAFLFDVTADYSKAATPAPIRLIALGRDTSATIDSGLSGLSGSGFQNEGDNEITGFHVSSGDPGRTGILGAREPDPFAEGWRVFYTQQHGDNFTWEILSR